MSAFLPEKKAQAEALSLLLAQRVREYFKSPENREAFEEWYFKRTGQKYEWKSVDLEGGK